MTEILRNFGIHTTVHTEHDIAGRTEIVSAKSMEELVDQVKMVCSHCLAYSDLMVENVWDHLTTDNEYYVDEDYFHIWEIV